MVVIGDLYNVVTEVRGAPGTTQQFTFSLRNAGNQAGVITVELYDHNGNLVGSKDFYLEPGQTTSSYIEATIPSQVGTYTWTMIAVAGEPTDSVDITVVVEARSIAKFVSVSPTQFARKPGETVTISFTVQNTGYDGNIDVVLKDQNGNVIWQKTYYILSGDTTEDSVTITVPSQPGTYTYTLEAYGYVGSTRVDTPDDTVTITGEVGYPHFTITNYPDVVTQLPNTPVDITIRVLNDGVVTGTVRVELYDENQNLVAQQEVQLYAGVYQDITFTITTPSTVGYHTYTVKAYNIDTGNYDDQKSFYVNVVASGNPIADITKVSPTTVTAKPNQTISFYVEVQNIGDVVGDIIVQLIDHNGNVVDSEAFASVSPGETRSTSLYGVAPSQTGTYTWQVVAFASSQTEPDEIVKVTVTVSVNYAVTITEVNPSYIEGNSGDRVTITWWVRNDSDVPATIVTKLLDNNMNVIVQYTAEMSPGDLLSFSYTITLPNVDQCTQMSYYVTASIDTLASDEKNIGLYVCPPPTQAQPTPTPPTEEFAQQLQQFIDSLLATIMNILLTVVYVQLMVALMTAIVSSLSRTFGVR